MPISYDIRPDQATVYLTYEGRITDAELVHAYERVYADAAYRPGYQELADCRRVSTFDVSVPAIRRTGELALIAAGEPPVPSRVAIVAETQLLYGLARLYQLVQEPTSELVEVFTDIGEARRWLGLDLG